MEELERLNLLIKGFSDLVNEHKELDVHKYNKFNKQCGDLFKDYNYLKIIIERIEMADSNKDIVQLNLDLKTLYIFGRVFSESLIYTISLFIKNNTKLEWTKIGPFLSSVKNNFNSESDEFKNFWKECEKPIKILYDLFKYRNFVLHEKDSNTEWTFSWPNKSNLDNVYISNVPWEEDKDNKKEEKTLNARNIINKLYIESYNIINYIKKYIINILYKPKNLLI